jgi:hypothetical protein
MDIAEYDIAKVAKLLEKMNLASYVPAFEANQVDGQLLMQMDHGMLKDDLGMSSKLDRLRLLKQVKELLDDGLYEPVIVSPATGLSGSNSEANNRTQPVDGVAMPYGSLEPVAAAAHGGGGGMLTKQQELDAIYDVPAYDHSPTPAALLSARKMPMAAKQAAHAKVMAAAATARTKMVAANPAAARAANERVDGEGRTKLCVAVRDNLGDDKASQVAALLAAGADPNLGKSTDGATPLIFAAQSGSIGACIALVRAGADPSTAKFTDGATPVYVAAQNGHLGVLVLLLDTGTSPSTSKTDAGATPVFIAAQNGHVDCIKALLNAGASPASPAKDGTTPLQAAQHFGHRAVVALLQHHLNSK